GRVRRPWGRRGEAAVRRPLLEHLLGVMRDRGFTEAWAAYRADWEPVLAFLRDQGFAPSREMVNFVAETGQLPRLPAPFGLTFGPLLRDDLPRMVEIGRGLFAGGLDRLRAFYWENPYFGPDQLFALRPAGGRPGAGAAAAP